MDKFSKKPSGGLAPDVSQFAKPLSDLTNSERNRRTTIPVIEESLQIEKREVETDGYRLTKRVEVHQELVDEELRNQRIEIERRAIGKQLDIGETIPASHYEGDTLVIPIVEEVLVTEKRLVLVEEVRITRIQGTHRLQETVELRKEIMEIEQLAAGSPTDKLA